jgi:hypothetical protein
LVEVDRDAGMARSVLNEPLAHRGAGHLCLSADRATLYFATTTDVGAVDLAKGVVIWRQALGTYARGDFVNIYALALSADGRRLAAGGIASGAYADRALAILDAGNGKIEHARGMRGIGGTSIRSLAWHPSGWLAAGSSSGAVAHVNREGRLRVYKAAAKGVEALLFQDSASALLVGGNEKQLRWYELLEDERGGRF